MKERLKLHWRRLSTSGWDTTLEHGLEAMKEINEAIQKPSVYSFVRVAMSTVRTFSANDLYFHDVLDHARWKQIFPSCIKNQLLEILEPLVTSKIKTSSSGDTVLHMIIKPGIKIAWAKENNDNAVSDIMASVDFYEKSSQFVRELLWKTIDPSRVILTTDQVIGKVISNTAHARNAASDQLKIVTDDLIQGITCSAADEWADYLRKCVNVGVKRTVLFHGIAGSGKSTLTRTICDKLQMRSLRIRVDDIGFLSTEALAEIISIFEPDVVIFDDLDRSMSQVALLETMEMLHKHVKLVFATVNNLGSLTVALKRPGRFDEIVHVSKLDVAAIHSILGPDNMGVFDIVKDWPVAFIKEYVIRCRVLGSDKAMSSIKELQKRVKDLVKLSEVVEDEEE